MFKKEDKKQEKEPILEKKQDKKDDAVAGEGEIKGEKDGDLLVDRENGELKEQLGELTTDLQRTRADFENYRKQVEVQRAQAVQIAKEATVKEILPLLDNLKLAISTYPKELMPLKKTLEKTLGELGLKEVLAETGVEFNPDVHEAVMVDEAEGEKEVVSEVLRPGYYYKENILRPAMVKVTRE